MKLKSIEAIQLHRHFSLNHVFTDGVNIIFGNNGGGKTTLLNIVANALNGNFNRFAFLEFSSINIEFDDGTEFTISRNIPSDQNEEEMISFYINEELIASISALQITSSDNVLEEQYTELMKFDLPRVVYIPAYRILYDHLSISPSEKIKMLSAFSPTFYFPNLSEIEERLKTEGMSGQISSEISLFIESLNKFFENKKIEINKDENLPPFEIIYDDKIKSRELMSLSSGERQISTMLYAITLVKPGDIILIDEPEISLHVGWQRKFIRTIFSMHSSEQLIACTHSPVIGADFELKELEFRFVGGVKRL